MEADKLKLRVKTLNSELEQMSSMMSGEKVSLANEISVVRKEAARELEVEKRSHIDDIEAANAKHEMQKQEIEQVSLSCLVLP